MTGLGWFGRSDAPELTSVKTADTMRDAVDRDDLASRLPSDWTVRSDIVLYGNDTLTDVLVFEHRRTRQEIVVVPESNTDPNGPVHFYHHDRKGGRRRELPVRKPSLSEGLAYTLDRIERWTMLFTDGSAALPDDRMETSQTEETTFSEPSERSE